MLSRCSSQQIYFHVQSSWVMWLSYRFQLETSYLVGV